MAEVAAFVPAWKPAWKLALVPEPVPAAPDPDAPPEPVPVEAKPDVPEPVPVVPVGSTALKPGSAPVPDPLPEPVPKELEPKFELELGLPLSKALQGSCEFPKFAVELNVCDPLADSGLSKVCSP